VGNRRRELFADWLIVFGGLGLLISLFLTWSHQFSVRFLAQFGSAPQLRGIPHDPTAWQVYSVADLMLGLLAVWLIGVALLGGRTVRMVALAAGAVALAFTLHALSVPPTNGANIVDPSLSLPSYFPNSPGAGPGETVAIASLGVALLGLGLSFTAE
jgi:hypothetical protein